MKKRCFAYVRVSTSEQAEDGLSIAAQKERIRKFALGNDLELVRTFTDAGLSGKAVVNRPALNQCLRAVCDEGAILIVYSLSRLSRSIRDTLNISDRLQKNKADLISLSESLDTTSASGRLTFHILTVLAQFEREQISERVREVSRYKKSRLEIYSPTPFGFERDKDRLIPNPREQRTIVRMVQLRQSGLSFRAIADALNADGIPTKKGKLWGPSGVRYILNNELHAKTADAA